MQKYTLYLGFILLLVSSFQVNAQQAQPDSTKKKYFLGSTVFLLGNFSTVNAPDFAQLNFGYRVSDKSAVSLEIKTWKYAWSLGIPYGKSFEAPEEEFPGYIREFGFAMVYQSFIWRGLYASVHSMSAWQTFNNEDGNKIDNGFQVFNTYRIGYHVKFFKDRFFIEPSIAITHRPYHTQMPDGFKQLDDKWPKYFLGEPGLHIGFNF